ncbi:poly(U)-specific 3'-to-5' RNA exonuclease [Mactra antiquata]
MSYTLCSQKIVLPLPDDIKNIYSNGKHERHEDSASFDGRVRSFPHEEGNWATSIYACYDCDDDNFIHLKQELFKCLYPHEFKVMEDYHVSLSRTVTVRHHWIEDISKMLTKKFSNIKGCCCEVDNVDILVNDEKTRSFLVLTVCSANDVLEQYVSVVDECFEEYKLQKYYQPPKFHVSIGWCLGDVTEKISSKTYKKLKDVLNVGLQESSDLKYFFIDELNMKTGNKKFVFKLDSD